MALNRKRALVPAVLALTLGVAAIGCLATRAGETDGDSDGRDQTATWVAGGTSAAHLSAKATTWNNQDRELQVEVRDATTNEVIADWSITLIPPNGSVGSPATVEINDPLEGYSSQSKFTIVGRYYDAGGALVDTETIRFTKPE